MRLFLILFLTYFSLSHSAYCQNPDVKKPVIAASINPIYQIVLAITQDKADVTLIIAAKSRQHDHFFKKSDIERVMNADLIFYVSDDLEHKFSKLLTNFNRGDRAVELANVKGMKILERRKHPHRIDTHIWLNPQNAIKIAQTIAQEISKIDPDNAQAYQANLATFIDEVKHVERKVQIHLNELKTHLGYGYIFYHDGYQYFEDYFGVTPLKVVSYDHDSELTVGIVKEINDLMKNESVRCVFGSKQDQKNTAMKLAKNYHVKFATLDLIGLEEKPQESKLNGYSWLLVNMTRDLAICLEDED